MCLIAYTEDKTKIDLKALENAYDNNPHGWGIAFAQDNRLFTCKRMANYNTFINIFKEVPSGVPLLIHFRWRTHGTQDLTNVHPFEIFSINGGDSLDLCMAHNGVISSTNKFKENNDDPRSDTSLYVDTMLKPLLKNNENLLFNPHIAELIEKDIGHYNKFAFLYGDGRHLILNKKAGYETSAHPGVWFSNSYSIGSNTYRDTTATKAGSGNRSYSQNYQSKNGHYDYQSQKWVASKSEDTATTVSPITTEPRRVLSTDTYVIEENLPQELADLVAEKGVGSVLLSPTQNSQIFGPGWVKTGNVIYNAGSVIVKAHNQFIVSKTFKAKDKGNVQELVTYHLTSKLNSSDFRVMNESEIMEWIVGYPRECAAWLLSNMNFSGNTASIEAWLQGNLDKAVDIIYQKTHFNKNVTPVAQQDTSDDEYQYDYMFAM